MFRCEWCGGKSTASSGQDGCEETQGNSSLLGALAKLQQRGADAIPHTLAHRGTLSAGLVVHPRTMKDKTTAEAVERAIARLRYGTVTVNAWSGLSFAFGTPPWGAHPSSTPVDIQSGAGWVHNTSMLEGIEKAVMRHPITAMPKPSYSLSHRSAHSLMARVTALEERASWAKVPAVLAAAMRA